MDTEKGLLKKYTREVGYAYGTLRETQVRNALLAQAEQAVLYGGAATSKDTVDETSELDFKLLRVLDKALKDIKCPYTTKVLDGSPHYGTIAIGEARYVYVGNELRPSLEDMEHNGRAMWVPMEDYAYGKDLTQGEVGRIGAFRFIEVNEMPSYQGQGAEATDDNYYSSTGDDGNERYDVFPVLFVGPDSFATIAFEANSARVKTAMPKIIPGVDNYGKLGVVSIAWYFGILFTRPERIRMCLVSARIA